MKNVRRSVGFVAAAGLASVFAMVPMIASQGGASPATTSVVLGTHSTAATASNDVGSVPAGTAINFNVTLNPRNAAGVAAEAKAVSDPASSSYKHYLTIAQWERQFSPTSADVGQVTSWLKGAGLTVGAVSADRLSISVSGTAAQVEHAFGTKLDYYKVNGQKVWMITSNVSVPTSVAGYVQGFPGLSQIVNTSDATTGVAATAASDASSGNAVVSTHSATSRIPQRRAVFHLLRAKGRHDRPRLWRRLPGHTALQPLWLHTAADGECLRHLDGHRQRRQRQG
jgi:subtilase family serine protease